MTVKPKKAPSPAALESAETTGAVVSSASTAGTAVGGTAAVVGLIFGFALAGVFMKFS